MVYLDGVEIASVTGLSSIVDSSGTLTFLDNFDGEVREIRVFDTALTSTEVSSSLNTAYDGSEANLILLYDFEEGSGTSVTDLTASGNDGVLTNPLAMNWVTVQSVPEDSAAGTVVGYLIGRRS